MGLWIALGLLVLVLLYAVIVYNRLVRLRALVREGFSGITVQLRRRADLVPNLVSTVEGYATHEREVLTEVTAHRTDPTQAGGVARHRRGRPGVRSDARPADGGRRGLSRPQGRRQFPPAPGRARRDRGAAAGRAPLLQRHRPRPQHPASSPSPTCCSPGRWASAEEPFYADGMPASRPRPRSASAGPADARGSGCRCWRRSLSPGPAPPRPTSASSII